MPGTVHSTSTDLDPITQLVVSGTKPSALIAPESLHASSYYTAHGIELVRGLRGVGAIAYPTMAWDVIERSKCGDELSDLAPRIAEVADSIGHLSIAQAVVTLDRTLRLDKASRAYPEADALLGSLLGYALCDIRYYIGRRYLGDPEHPASVELTKQLGTFQKDWPDSHILCGQCAMLKTIELQQVNDE